MFIKCPTCKENTFFDYDGKGQSVLTFRCKNCREVLKYNPQTQKIEVIVLGLRNTSSGMRFY